MKVYTVDWDDEATQMLADIFVSAPDPNALWPAQAQADRLLEQQPRSYGYELSEGVPPFKIFYEIDDTKRVVTVTHVEIFKIGT
ncbi:MAG TPA: hypothetical protein VFE62_02170 [Gemmataceae bacterium]|nr:hypothetical protein [Gemmataceae bacterium]